MRSSTVAVSVLAAALLGVGATSASAAFVGTVSDPAGDQVIPGRDITSVAFSYSRSGRMSAQIRTRAGAGDDRSVMVSAWAGTMGPDACNVYPAVGFTGSAGGADARWHLLRGVDDTDWGFADRDGGGGTALTRFSTTSSQLRGLRPNCLTATIHDADDAAIIHDTVVPVRLRPVAELEARLGKLPAVVRPGKTYPIRVVLTNPGDAPTGRLRVGAAAVRGLKVVPRDVPSIRAGGRRIVAVPVSVTSRARTSTPLRITVAAGPLKSRVEGSLYVAGPRPTGGRRAGTPAPRLCNRWMPDLSGQTGGSLVLVLC